ncbi:MAG: polysaccharide biosynthesis protein [Clostridia bacterium]|nr:polysaccharide biosynthesis protein [Clostridia bacterium]
MKKRSFLIGAFILAVGGFLAKVIGAAYKIPLTHILGANGMGIYYLVFPMYSLCLIVASGGVSVAVSKLVAEERGKFNRKKEKKIIKYALIISIVISIILTIFTILASKLFSFLQGNANAMISYIAIAPSIIFASVISVIKGYFQGVENMVPSSVSLILEQIGKLVFGLLFAYQMLDMGVTYAVLGAIIGVTLSELFAMLYMIIRYIIYRKKQFYKFFEKRKKFREDEISLLKSKVVNSKKVYLYATKCSNCHKGWKKKNKPIVYYFNNLDCCKDSEIVKRVVRYSIPSTLSNLIMPLSIFIDSFLVVNILVGSGMSTNVATSLYGVSNGIVASLISLPTIIISAISMSIVPNLSSSIELNSREVVLRKTNFFIKFTWIISLAMFILYIIFSPEIIEILYSGGLSTKVIDEYTFSYKLLALSSISIIYNAFLYTFTAILNAFDKPQVPFYSQAVALVFRIFLTFVLVSIPSINVFGLTIANIIFLSISCFGCIREIQKTIPLKTNIRSFLYTPIFCAVFSSLIGYGIKKLLYGMLPTIAEIVIVGSVIILLYIILIFTMRVFTIKEWEYLPIPKFLIKFLPRRVKDFYEKMKV